MKTTGQEVYLQKYYLSTEPYYFVYRPDNNNHEIRRATLFDGKKRIDDVRVSAYVEFGLPEKSHQDVINYFEARITLEIIKYK